MPSRQQLQTEFAQRDISFQLRPALPPLQLPLWLYVQLDDDDTHLWHSVIFVQDGPFSGGVFRFDIVFPHLPSAIPQVFFHPPSFTRSSTRIRARLLLRLTFSNGLETAARFRLHILQFVEAAFQEDTLMGLREGTVANPEVCIACSERIGTLFNKLAHAIRLH